MSLVCARTVAMAAVLWKIFLWVRTIPPTLYMFIFSNPKKTQLSSDWTAFPDDFSFRDPDYFSTSQFFFPANSRTTKHASRCQKTLCTLAAHWCTQILCAGARRRQARQAHAVWHHRDGSRCTDEKPALSSFQNSQKHNARCHTAAGKRLMDVAIAVLKRVKMNRDGGD